VFLISHRGNINGPSDKENSPIYIDKAIESGYDVEIDVWTYQNEYWLGHNKPQYKIDLDFLLKRSTRLWCHAKNLKALESMLDNKIHCFWQHEDDYAITSKGYIFTHSNVTKETSRSVIVSLSGTHPVENPAGICSDYISKYKNEKR